MISEELLSPSSNLKLEAAGFSETLEPIYQNIWHHITEDHSLILSTVITSGTLESVCIFPPGVHSIAYAFPGVRIVTSALDPEINGKFHVLPGIGNFGDRYFGTEPTEET
jgi:Uracil phosphoribosyltransferase